MSTINLPFNIPISSMGLPTKTSSNQPSAGYNAILNAMEGEDACTNWVLPYGAIQQLGQALPQNTPVNAASAYGDYSFSKNMGSYDVSIFSNTTVHDDVISGQTPPQTYTQDGDDYNIIGSIEHNIAFNGVTAWSVSLPMMLLSSVPMTVLGSVGMKAFIKPMISKVYQGVKTALTTTVEEGMEETAVMAAADTAAEAVEVSELVLTEAAVDATLSIETGGLALVGFVGLLVVQVGIMLVVHDSYHELIIYNFTDYDISWGSPELKHDAEITLEPVTDTSGDTPSQTLPAMSGATPMKYVAPVESASMAMFNVYSGSEVYGCKWGLALTITDPNNNDALIDTAGAMWDIPLGGQNSIGVDQGVTQSGLSDWVDHEEGKHNDHTRSKSLSHGITVTNSIDHLQGKHQMTPGSDDTAYIYRSVLVFDVS